MSEQNHALSINHFKNELEAFIKPNLYPALHTFWLKHGRLVVHQKGDVLVHQYQKLDYISVILSGTAKVELFGFDEKTIQVTKLGVGTWYGALDFIDDIGASMDLKAVTSIHEYRIPFSALRRQDVPETELYKMLAYYMCARLRDTHKIFSEHKIVDFEDRLLTRLELLADEDGYITTSKEIIAGYLGVSRYKVSRELKKLEQRGQLVRHYRKVQLIHGTE